jgi:hypothetical protein
MSLLLQARAQVLVVEEEAVAAVLEAEDENVTRTVMAGIHLRDCCLSVTGAPGPSFESE